MANKDIEVFEGKSLDNVLKDIYINSIEKRETINNLISTVSGFIVNSDDVMMILPLINNCLEVGIKNDDMLVKLANIVSKANVNTGSGDTSLGSTYLSDAEKKMLAGEAKRLVDSISIADDDIKSLNNKLMREKLGIDELDEHNYEESTLQEENNIEISDDYDESIDDDIEADADWNDTYNNIIDANVEIIKEDNFRSPIIQG